MKRLSLIAGALLCTALVVRGIHYGATEGFCLRRIQANVAFAGDLSLPLPSQDSLKAMAGIAQQRFHYLKKGSQAYAFVSDDGQYVLKLFKLHHLRSADWLHNVPLPSFLCDYRDNLVLRRQYRIDLTLNSYKLAAKHLCTECALVYAQILPTTGYSLPVTIQDSLGRIYTIDLARHGFALQRKARLVIPAFEQWISEKDFEHAARAIDSLVALIAQRSSKGIQDSDPDLHKNAGLLGDSAILIDLGSFYANPAIKEPALRDEDLKKVFLHFSEWLAVRSPQLYDHLQERLSAPDKVHWMPSEQMEEVMGSSFSA
jgi:hypothetical protein